MDFPSISFIPDEERYVLYEFNQLLSNIRNLDETPCLTSHN